MLSRSKLPALSGAAPGRIERYDLIAEIASGGMATVYLGQLSGVGGFRRLFAIKRLHPHLAREEEFVQMFLDEARLAAAIHHPNVVGIVEVGAGHAGYYLAMEYVEGDTLARLLGRVAAASQSFPVRVATRIAIDMLRGLHSAHELCDEAGELYGLVHRDVSPQNVLVGIDGISRITDFGVAHATTRLSSTRAGQLKGKIAYMAPEQAASEPTIDRRADVFSAGIVLWEALAGRRLFKANNDAATLSRVISEPVTHPSLVNPALAPAIGDVCMKALARDIDARYKTSLEFADDLEAVATRLDLLGTAKEVAEVVSRVLGDDIAQQREIIRQWSNRGDQSLLYSDSGPASSPSGPRLASEARRESNVRRAPVGEPFELQDTSELQFRDRGKRRTLGIVVVLAALAIVVGLSQGTSWFDTESGAARALAPESNSLSGTAATPGVLGQVPAITEPNNAVAGGSPAPAPSAPSLPVAGPTPALPARSAPARADGTRAAASAKANRAATSPKDKPKINVDLSNPYR